MRKLACIAASFFLIMVGNDQGRTQILPGRELQDPMFQAPVVTNCWTEARTFSSLKTGDADFCKKHIKYAPGALDCYTFETQVCEVYQPATRQLTQDRRPLSPRVIECPDEPEPPLCPSTPALRW
jgi:hypothetical protein